MATETSSTGRDSDKFMLRFPKGMRDEIALAAKSNNRSMNAEIVARLEQSFASEGPQTTASLRAELDKLSAKVDEAMARMKR